MDVLRASALPLSRLCGPDALTHEAPAPLRLKRTYVDADHGIPFLSSSDIISLRPEINHYLSTKLTRQLDRLLIRKWDVLISRSGTVGNVALAGGALGGMALSEHVIRLQADDATTAGFITAFLRSNYGRPQLRQASYGSVVVHIEPQHLSRILIPDLHPVRRTAIGSLMLEATEDRDDANRLLAQADAVLHERLGLKPLPQATSEHTNMVRIRAAELSDRFDSSFHAEAVQIATDRLQHLGVDLTRVDDLRLSHAVSAVTKFRKRVYVRRGGIPLLSSKQLFQVDPVDRKGLAKGAHTKDLPEIALREGMLAVTCSGTIGRVQILPAYMSGWAASQHALRIMPADGTIGAYLYAWLASDYGSLFLRRNSYGSVIVHIDRDMLAAVPVPYPSADIRREVGELVLQANKLRDAAWNKEQSAIGLLESLVQVGVKGVTEVPRAARENLWADAVDAVRSSPHLRSQILESVMSSMAFEGFAIDRERSEALLDQALNGPALEYPGRR